MAGAPSASVNVEQEIILNYAKRARRVHEDFYTLAGLVCKESLRDTQGRCCDP